MHFVAIPNSFEEKNLKQKQLIDLSVILRSLIFLLHAPLEGYFHTLPLWIVNVTSCLTFTFKYLHHLTAALSPHRNVTQFRIAWSKVIKGKKTTENYLRHSWENIICQKKNYFKNWKLRKQKYGKVFMRDKESPGRKNERHLVNIL